MKRWCIALIAVSAMAIAGLVVAETDSSEADSSPPPKCAFNFTIVDVNNVGIGGVTVHLVTKTGDVDAPLKEIKKSIPTNNKGEASLSYTPSDAMEVYAGFERNGYTVSKVEGSTTMTRWAVINGEFVNTEADHTIAGGDLIALSSLPAKQSKEDITVKVTMIATTFTTTLHDCDGKGLSNVKIKTKDIFGEDTYTTENDGSFTINLSSNYGTRLYIDKTGYTATEIVPYMTIGTDNGTYVNINVSGEYSDGGIPWSTLKNNSKKNDLISYYYPKSIVMYKANGNLSVQVQMSDRTPIVDADVTVVNEDTGVFFIKSTDSDGFAEFDVPVGNYYYKISVGGFEDYDSREKDGNDLGVSTGQTTSATPILKEKSSPTYFGLNTGHILMIAGIVIGTILALLSCLLYTRCPHFELEGNEN